jgi:flavin-dependent dehydrogenase
MTTYDVVVVGGRVAGASTALLLARAGVRVAVVERGDLSRDPVSTPALMRAGVLQLARWSVLDRVVGAPTPPVRQTLFRYPDGDRLTVSVRSHHGVDALYAPRRRLLDRILLEAAEEAGAVVLRRTEVLGLEHDAHGSVSGVLTQGPGPGRVTLRAGLTIGADGIRSTVARHAGAAVVRHGTAASAVLYRYVHDVPVIGYEWLYGTMTAAGLIPTNDGDTCIFVSTTPSRMRALRRLGQERAFQVLLDQADPGASERLRTAGTVGHMRGWRGQPGYIRRPWGPGWALVGDAGYFKDPITAHGLTDALRDAELVAEATLTALSDPREGPRAMAAYERTRDRLSGRLWEATEQVAGYRWNADQARTLVRAVSGSMSDEVEHLNARSLPGESALTTSPSGR